MTSVSMNEELRLHFRAAYTHDWRTNERGWRKEEPNDLSLSWSNTIRSHAKRGVSIIRGRSPDWQVIAKPAAFPSRQAGTVAFKRRFARCSQWRNRAGISPASLFTHRLKVSTSGHLLFITTKEASQCLQGGVLYRKAKSKTSGRL